MTKRRLILGLKKKNAMEVSYNGIFNCVEELKSMTLDELDRLLSLIHI